MKRLLEHNHIKSDIIKASGEVFMKYGFTRVSMQDISKACGKGRSTLYYYFNNKLEVLEAFGAEEFNNILNDSQKMLYPEKGFAFNIESYYKTKLQVYKIRLLEYSALVEDIKADPAIFIKKNKLFFKEESAIIKKIIGWAIAQKELQAMPEDDLNFLADLLVTAFRSFEQEMILFGGMDNFESKIKWLTEILYKGLK